MELLRNVRFVSEGFSAKCRKISRLQEKAFQNGIPPQCMRMSEYIDPNSTLVCGVESSEISTKSVLCRMPKSSTQEGGMDRDGGDKTASHSHRISPRVVFASLSKLPILAVRRSSETRAEAVVVTRHPSMIGLGRQFLGPQSQH